MRLLLSLNWDISVSYTHLDIDPEVMQYVATNINSNIRELEGALNKIFVFANLEKKPVTLELAENALKDTIECQKEVTPQLIMDVVAEHYNISVSDIISKKKNKEIANPRQICMYLSRKYTCLLYTSSSSQTFSNRHKIYAPPI